MLVARVLELRVGQAAEALHEQHHGRHAGAGDLGGVMERTRRQAMRRSRYSLSRVVAEVDQGRVEQDRLDVPDPLPGDLEVLLGGEELARLLCQTEELR